MKQAIYSVYKEGDSLTLKVENPDQKTVQLLTQIAVNGINDICGFEYEKEEPLPQEPQGFSLEEIKAMVLNKNAAAQYGMDKFIEKAEKTLNMKEMLPILNHFNIKDYEDHEKVKKDLANAYFSYITNNYIRLYGRPKKELHEKPVAFAQI